MQQLERKDCYCNAVFSAACPFLVTQVCLTIAKVVAL